MPKVKSDLEMATGKLISLIQREWGESTGESDSDFIQDLMDRAHDLLQAKNKVGMSEVLDGLTVKRYLGEVWLKERPAVSQQVELLEVLLRA